MPFANAGLLLFLIIMIPTGQNVYIILIHFVNQSIFIIYSPAPES